VQVDLTQIKPYADHLGDGLVQFSFTLPVPDGPAARKAALELGARMGLADPEVVHHRRVSDGYTYFVMYGRCGHAVDYTSLKVDELDLEYIGEEEIDAYAAERIGRPIVVVGACTGSDTHSVGIDAMLDLKGFHGHRGLEGYNAFRAHNLGSQVPNSVLVAKAIELDADAILVSQTVTQQDLHIHNLTELVEIVEAEGRRRQMILVCGGSRVSNELAKELGFDAGFSRGTYPHHLATFLLRELAARLTERGGGAGNGRLPAEEEPGVPEEPGVTDERRAKLERLSAEGVEPYPYLDTRVPRTPIGDIQAAHDPERLQAGAHPGLAYRVCGRLIARRGHARMTFFDVRDQSGEMQLVARREALGEDAYERILDLDIGDIVSVEGSVYVTKKAQLALDVGSCTMLAKALRPPPDRHHGMEDPGARYRYRELDLLANSRTREMFFKRTHTIEAIHEVLREKGFTQIETPMLQTLAGGAASRPFTTHHNALDVDVHLRISVELYLNRCIVGGLENVYDLGRAFRNEGISHRHSPEFTILECMMSYADYLDVAVWCEELAEQVALRTLGSTKIEQHDGQTIDLARPWRRVTLREAIADAVGVDYLDASREELERALGEEVDREETWGKLVEAIYVKYVEPTLMQPTHVFDFPLELFPICKRHPRDPRLAEHFDTVIRGMEVLSGDTELNDPLDQWDRFVKQRRQRGLDDGGQPHPYDEEYVRALEYGMAPTTGGGLGVDRLLMVLSGVESIREVVPFPTLRERR
jgi:lysyl-tRNA synthetase, class II